MPEKLYTVNSNPFKSKPYKPIRWVINEKPRLAKLKKEGKNQYGIQNQLRVSERIKARKGHETFFGWSQLK